MKILVAMIVFPVVALMIVFPALADPGSSPFAGYDLQNFQKPVFRPFIESQGEYIWYGAQTGLFRRNTHTGATECFTEADGLSCLGVTCMEAAPDGEVWIASGSEVARYNGVSWKRFSAADGLSGTPVSDIAAAPNGDIWVGSHGETGGISRFDGKTWKTYAKADGLIAAKGGFSFGSYCNCLAVGPDGTVWASGDATSGSQKYGLYSNSVVYSFDGTSWVNRGAFDGRYIDCIAVGNDGSVWVGSEAFIGSGGGLSRYDGSAWQRIETFVQHHSTYRHTVSKIRFDRDGSVWGCVGKGFDYWDSILNNYTTGGGIFHQEGQFWNYYLVADGLASNSVFDITCRSDGSVWAVTAEALCRRNGEKWETVSQYQGLLSNSFQCLTVDTKGNLWGGSSGGVVCFDGTGWTKSFQTERGENPYFLATDRDGSVWAGFRNNAGLWRYHDAAWKMTGRADGMNVAEPYDMLVMATYPDNGLLAAVCDDGNNQYYYPERLKFISFHNDAWETSRLPNWLYFMTITPEGVQWLGTKSNLYWYAPGKDGMFAVGKDFPGSRITALASGPGGRTWVGTDVGAAMYDGIRWTCYPINREVTAIAVDVSGKAWIGANGVVSMVEDQQWYDLTAAQGLVSGNVTSIAAGPDGTVWIGTDGGLTRMSPRPTSVEEKRPTPSSIAITGNYPNPFNPATAISFTLSQSARTELAIYSITGQKVRTLMSGPMDAGTHSAVWDGRDDNGKAVSSGIYIAQLRSGKQVSGHKMLFMK